MDKNQIGTNAGIVWNILKDNAHWQPAYQIES